MRSVDFLASEDLLAMIGAVEKEAEQGASPTQGPDEPPDRADEHPERRRRVLVVLTIVTAVVVVAGFLWWLHARNFETTDDAYIDADVVPIAPQVSARVATSHVQDNVFVRRGDLLVELDPTGFEIALSQARGAEASALGHVEQAQAGVNAADAQVAQAQAEVNAARATFANAQRDYRRLLNVDPRARSQQRLDGAHLAQKTAAAGVAQAVAAHAAATAKLKTATATVAIAQGDAQKARADTLTAEMNLGYCRILAPCDGRVTKRNVEPGMYVTPSTPLFLLVQPDVWVVANFKETQLANIAVGQPVRIRVDAFPDEELHGTVNSIQAGTGSRFSVIPAENATGNFVKIVQRVPVKITFNNRPNDNPPRHRLSPGMSVEPRVRVRE